MRTVLQSVWGLATAVNRLKDSKAKSKVVILLTDGVNNTGFVAPETAADIAKTYGVRVYTIGVGTRGMAPYPAKFKTWGGQVVTKYQNIEVNIDEDVLKSIASITDGKYSGQPIIKASRRFIQKSTRWRKPVFSIHIIINIMRNFCLLHCCSRASPA